MALPQDLKDQLDGYARGDLNGDLDSHISFFDFLGDDQDLQRRVGEEYFSARYLYKLFEGLRLEDEWSRRAQVQLQVQQYASIYEACIHHLLFKRAAAEPVVQNLLKRPTLKPWSVSSELSERLAALDGAGQRQVVAAVQSELKIEETKVRFDSKARAAFDLGIIDEALKDELIEFYTARNMIHIHAELKKGADWRWEIEFAKMAYWRLQKFAQQARAWTESSGG